MRKTYNGLQEKGTDGVTRMDAERPWFGELARSTKRAANPGAP